MFSGCCSQLVEESHGNSSIKDSTPTLQEPLYKKSKNGSTKNNDKNHQTLHTSLQTTNSTVNPIGKEFGPIEVPGNASALGKVRSNSTSGYENTSGSTRKPPVEQGWY